MDEHTLLQTLNFGGPDNRTQLYSNLPRPFLDQRITELEELNRTQPFLEPGKNLVVMELNHHYLEYVVDQLFPEFLAEKSTHEQQPGHSCPHHLLPNYVDVHNATNGSLIRQVSYRTKGVGSTTEKLPREFAGEGTIESQLFPYHTIVEDAYGIGVTGKDEQACYDIARELMQHPFLNCVEFEDYLTQPKPSGYRAIHLTCQWGQNHIPTGMLVEFHLETEADQQANKGEVAFGRAHELYGQKKLLRPHEQGPHQIVVVTPKVAEARQFPIKNEFAAYTLVQV